MGLEELELAGVPVIIGHYNSTGGHLGSQRLISIEEILLSQHVEVRVGKKRLQPRLRRLGQPRRENKSADHAQMRLCEAEVRQYFFCDTHRDRLVVGILHQKADVVIGRGRAQQRAPLTVDSLQRRQLLDRRQHFVARVRDRVINQSRRQFSLQPF